MLPVQPGLQALHIPWPQGKLVINLLLIVTGSKQLSLGTGDYAPCLALPLANNFSNKFSYEHPFCLTVGMMNRVVCLLESA